MKSSDSLCHGPSSGVPSPRNPSTWSDHLYVELARTDIALFKFILESCDNLAYLSVLDKYRALVRITFAHDMRETVLLLVQSMEDTVTIHRCFSIPCRH
jgi:hypothetical protein